MNLKLICEVTEKEGKQLLNTQSGKEVFEQLKSNLIISAEQIYQQGQKPCEALIVINVDEFDNAYTKKLWSSNDVEKKGAIL
jgi:ATP-dependent protease HslVU (ClpYQ) ATPase subunit